MKNPPIIELRNVNKRFPATRRSGEVVAIENLSLSIEDRRAASPDGCGEFVVLLGPSGCGKSTILTLISGLALSSGGEVLVYGQPVKGPHRYSATVPQAYTCFPWLNALQNVGFGLGMQRISEEDRWRIAYEYLAKVGLAEFAGAYQRQLSGGMQQRVAIARTLAVKRPIVLMDEPFGALDAQTRAEMQQMLLKLWEQERNTIVFVTHDITEALLLADRIIVFSPRPARIIHTMMVPFPFQRPPEIVHEPEFVRCAEELRQWLRPDKDQDTLGPPPGIARFSRRVRPASIAPVAPGCPVIPTAAPAPVTAHAPVSPLAPAAPGAVRSPAAPMAAAEEVTADLPAAPAPVSPVETHPPAAPVIAGGTGAARPPAPMAAGAGVTAHVPAVSAPAVPAGPSASSGTAASGATTSGALPAVPAAVSEPVVASRATSILSVIKGWFVK